MLLVFPETPIALIRKKKNEGEAIKALKKLRNSNDVETEIDNMKAEINKESKNSSSVSMAQLFVRPELRWPLITGLVIQVSQQLCGINAVIIIFFFKLIKIS